MDLSSVAGVDPDTAASLRAAGILSVADLARTADVKGLFEATGLTATTIDRLRGAAQQRVVQALREVGIPDEASLAEADAGDLARRTGIAKDDVEWFQAAARETLATASRVILRDGAATARVVLGTAAHESVPIVTARADENVSELLGRSASSDAVALQEGATAAVARVAGREHGKLPIFREAPDGGVTRVRVANIRERQVVERGPSLLDRLRGKK